MSHQFNVSNITNKLKKLEMCDSMLNFYYEDNTVKNSVKLTIHNEIDRTSYKILYTKTGNKKLLVKDIQKRILLDAVNQMENPTFENTSGLHFVISTKYQNTIHILNNSCCYNSCYLHKCYTVAIFCE